MTPRPVPPLLQELQRLHELPEGVVADGDTSPATTGPSDEEVLAATPPESFARAVRAKVSEQDWAAARRRRSGLVLAVTVLASLLVFVQVGPTLLGRTDPGEDVLLKGLDARLTVYRQTDTTPARLADGDLAGPGDRLQLTVVAPGASTVLLVSVDGRGQVTEHLRHVGPGPLEGEVVLPQAFVLDDAPSFEVFHLLVAKELVDVGPWLGALQQQGARMDAPPPPPGAQLSRVLLRKVAP